MRALAPADSGAPPLEKEYRDDTSQRLGSASHASRRGLATASPTTVRRFTPSRSMVDHTSAGSREPCVRTTRLPEKNHMNDVHWAAACISGAIVM